MTSRLGLFIGILLALALAACGSDGAAGTPEPPDIQYGRDICVHCGMIINEEKFAAAYTLDDGTEKIFDDVGCIVLHQRMTGDVIDPEQTWVKDIENLEWVSVKDAYFVTAATLVTPMGHGIAAFGEESRAKTFASEKDGEIIRWDVVFALPEHNGLIGHHHEGKDHTGHTHDHSSHTDHGG